MVQEFNFIHEINSQYAIIIKMTFQHKLER